MEKNTVRRVLCLKRKTNNDILGNEDLLNAMRASLCYNIYDHQSHENW